MVHHARPQIALAQIVATRKVISMKLKGYFVLTLWRRSYPHYQCTFLNSRIILIIMPISISLSTAACLRNRAGLTEQELKCTSLSLNLRTSV